MKGQKKKALWAKKRVENAQKREEETKANTARRRRKSTKILVELQPRESKYVITDGMRHTMTRPSANLEGRVKQGMPVKFDEEKMKMSQEDYEAREAAAKKEIDRKKKMVAPMANKMGYQYVGDAPPEIIRTLGKKV